MFVFCQRYIENKLFCTIYNNIYKYYYSEENLKHPRHEIQRQEKLMLSGLTADSNKHFLQ